MYEKVTGSLVYALALIDQKEYEEAKQYIVGALTLFDDEYKVPKEGKTVVGQGDFSSRRHENSKKKRLKKR